MHQITVVTISNLAEYCEARTHGAELAAARLAFTCIISELGRGFAHKSLTLPSSIYILLLSKYSHFSPYLLANKRRSWTDISSLI